MVGQNMRGLWTTKAPGQLFLQVLLFDLSKITPPILHNYLSVIKGTNNWNFSAVPRDMVEPITDNWSAGEERQRNTSTSDAFAYICLIMS